MIADVQRWDGPVALPKLRRAVWLAVAAMTSFFLAMTFAYVWRDGLNTDWLSLPLAEILSANTCILIASSLALVRARQFFALRRMDRVLRWTSVALGMGIAFLLGQWLAWRTLWSQGVYLSGHPNSGFFFLVTAAHALHLTLGLALMAWLLTRVWRGHMPADRPLLMDLTSIVWHCLDVTWIYLYLVLVFYR